jgi:DNA-binding MarR family transcriptional regulator
VAKRPALPEDPIWRAAEHWRAHGWGDAADGMAVLTSVMRVQQIMLATVEEGLRPLGLTFARYEVLMLLLFSSRGSLPVGKVGERLQVHAASVTNAVRRLEADGFVRRVANPQDGRGVLAEITPAGREVAERATAVLNRDVFADLGLAAADEVALFRLLEQLRRAAGDFP